MHKTIPDMISGFGQLRVQKNWHGREHFIKTLRLNR